ncbi:hypothetical protein [Streptacidiphilus melanogenes]|uniref:hypothetical protein n=1 Tax=Streptacidiphilus melanogenes TaxID=411235 RepID=UPI0005AB0AF0|nr:hypothetical protein [Streptacidiphilus melanogenes]
MLSAIRRPAAQVAVVALCASALLGVTAPAFADAPHSASTSTVALPNMVVGQEGGNAPSPAPSTTPAPKKGSNETKIVGFVALVVAGVGGGLFISWTRARRRRQS